MNREAEIRRYLTTHHPETRFAAEPFHDAGFTFGCQDDCTLIPVIHVFTFFDRTAHLDDDEFGKALLGLSEFIAIFYYLTDREPGWWDDSTFDLVRTQMIEDVPELEACLAKAWDIQRSPS